MLHYVDIAAAVVLGSAATLVFGALLLGLIGSMICPIPRNYDGDPPWNS